MTLDKAIQVLKNRRRLIPMVDPEELDIAIDTIIQALETQGHVLLSKLRM